MEMLRPMVVGRESSPARLSQGVRGEDDKNCPAPVRQSKAKSGGNTATTMTAQAAYTGI